MSFLLEQKYRYIVFEPLGSIRSQLKSIVKTPWYDLAINFSGKVFDDNTFKLYSKMSMGFSVFGKVQNIAMISGKIETYHDQTNIQLEIKPTFSILLTFYLMLFIFLIKIFGLFTSRTQEDWIIVIGLSFLLIFMRSLIYFSIGQLKNRFEKVMGVHAEG